MANLDNRIEQLALFSYTVLCTIRIKCFKAQTFEKITKKKNKSKRDEKRSIKKQVGMPKRTETSCGVQCNL